MATAEKTELVSDNTLPSPEDGADEAAVVSMPNDAAIHRIRAVRQQQGLSLRAVSRRTGIATRQLREEEDETVDLTLTQLLRWAKALDVPVSELLVETDTSLSTPVFKRAQLVRIMKTVAAIRDEARQAGIRRMAETLTSQLSEVMPELKEVAPWPTVGQRRGLDEYGRALERRVSEEIFYQPKSWYD